MIVNTRDPEVGDALTRWFEMRDQLYDIRSQETISDADWERATGILMDLADIADELVAFLCPTARQRELHLAGGPGMTAMTPLSALQLQKALQLVAAWLGSQMRDDGQPCPTGRDASYSGLGPNLVPDWDWPSGGPTPTILLEGGPEDWAIWAGAKLRDEFAAIGVFAEPYASYALCLYSAR